jgi:hypothetical protein
MKYDFSCPQKPNATASTTRSPASKVTPADSALQTQPRNSGLAQKNMLSAKAVIQ